MCCVRVCVYPSLFFREVVGGILEECYGGKTEAFKRKAMAMEDALKRGMGTNLSLAYGEYDFPLFCRLIRAARPKQAENFVDIGSGCGRYDLFRSLPILSPGKSQEKEKVPSSSSNLIVSRC